MPAATSSEKSGNRRAIGSPAVLVASWFGVGFVPVAPGTFGTAAALPLAWAASLLGTLGEVAVLAVVLAVAIPTASRAGRLLGVIDARQIVIDEVAGLLVTMLGVPFRWPTALAAFVLFRAFDIFKPWPASYFDRKVKNGAGVVLDDVAAGLYARAGMALLALASPGLFR